MKTIKSKIMDIFEEIRKDNSCSFGDRKYLREYLGSVVINFRRKSDNQLVMKIYKSRNGAEIYIDNNVYFYKTLDDVIIIYNEYGKAVSITYADGYEWIGETFVSEDAILEENDFRMKYQNFIKNTKTSRNLDKIYDDTLELLKILENTTCICDTTEIYNNLNNIRNYFLNNTIDDYFNDVLSNVKGINNSLENYCKKEDEIDDALSTLNDYYSWILNLEKFNANKLNPDDEFFKLINETKKHINKLFKKTTISQNDWDLLEYYNYEIEKILINNSKITTNFSEKKHSEEVKLEFVDLNDVKEKEKEKDKTKNKKVNSFFKKATLDEKADYLTFQTLRKYGTNNEELNSYYISVRNAKKKLRSLNKTVKKYEKLILKDENKEIDNISYTTYNIVKSAKNGLENSGIINEKTTDEAAEKILRKNYDRGTYVRRQRELSESIITLNKIRNIIGNMSEESFVKIKNNYRKLKRKAIGLGTGIFAGILAVTSFGAGAYKNNHNNLKDNISLIYENDNITIYGDEDQTVEVTNSNVTFEDYLEGLGSKNILEQNDNIENETNVIDILDESNTEKETVADENIVVENETNTEKETVVDENIVVENETNTENETIVDDNIVVEDAENLIIETLDSEVPVEIFDENDYSDNLMTVEDEKDLLNTYKNELQNLQTLLPQSDVKLDNVRNIGDVVNITSNANLQNDEYSLIKNSEGHHSLYQDSLPRVICSVIMSDGNSGITAKTMEEAEDLINQGYYVAGYGLLNPYSTDANNLEGFFENEDVVGLVRK